MLKVYALVFILIFGFFLRYQNIHALNIVLDFDQYEDLFYTYRLVVDRDLLIIGRAVYGDARLHHGVFYYYYNFIPFLISKGSIFISAYWNSFFNLSSAAVIFFLARSLTGKLSHGLSALFIAALSFEIIKFSNWLTIDSPAIFIIPLMFLGLWKYYKGKAWGLILASFSLGLALQTDLSFLYHIPILLIYYFLFKPKIPNIKLFATAIFVFLLTISTLILTEIKLNFSGIKYMLNFSNTFSDATKLPIMQRISAFIEDFSKNFSNNLFPQRLDLGIYLAALIILVVLYFLTSEKTKKHEKMAVAFMLLYLFSPAITLFLGYHDKPWFLISLPPAIALISGYAISKLKYPILILGVLLIIGYSNTKIILDRPKPMFDLFDTIYDSTSYMRYQMDVLNYTYGQSGGEPFAINSVTYPLYYNGMWAYLYNYYGKKNFGYIPSWLGGDQIYPYDLLPTSYGDEKVFYMIISESARIPDVFKNKGRVWGEDYGGKLLEEKKFTGFTVLKYGKP